MKKKLTNSMRSKYNACHRAFKIAYEDLIRPAKDSEALSFGTAMHSMLELYWSNDFDLGEAGVQLTSIAEKASYDMDDKYVGYTLLALFNGYHERYADQDRLNFRCIGAELGFEAPLINPETGAASKSFVLAGKIDALAMDRNNAKFIVEHKTTSCDIGPGSDYWRKLPIDGQVSGYYVGAEVLGHEVQNCLYDVIRKPTIKPSNNIPLLDENGLKIVLDENGQRVMTKDGKRPRQTADAELGFVLQVREETSEEWFLRLTEDIKSRPDFYFARMDVTRSETDLQEYLYDMWSLSKEILEAEKNDRWSRNPNACSVFGSCEYFDVCTGFASLDDTTLFTKVDDTNQELK